MPHPVSPAPARLQRLRDLARLLDSAVGIPGTRLRIGLDGLIGLIPGVGDTAGALVSGYIVLQAARLGAPGALLARMGANVLLEILVGAIPLLGDLFDFGWKANLRNLRLLERHLADPERTVRATRRWVAAVGVGIVMSVAAVGALALRLAGALLDAVGLW